MIGFKIHFTQFQDSRISKLAIDLLITPYELSYNWERNKIEKFMREEDEKNRWN
mgnify:CR=1 FL=1